MGCVSCHEPSTGGTNGDSLVNLGQVGVTSAGGGFVGKRKAQTNTYASFNEPFFPCNRGGGSAPAGVDRYCGGNFWDGRALGRPFVDGEFAAGILPTPHIDDEIFYNIEGSRAVRYSRFISAISDQAMNPIPSVLEQNMPKDQVCLTVLNSDYAWLYRVAWGVDLNCSNVIAFNGETHLEIAFKRLMFSVGAYQHKPDINSFSSKRDVAIRTELACIDSEFAEYRNFGVCREIMLMRFSNPDKEYGKFPLVMFTDEENLGHDLFYNEAFPPFPGNVPPRPELPVTNCSFCHSDDPDNDDGAELLQTYMDQAYHNIGVPPNPEIISASGTLDAELLNDTTGRHNAGFVRTPTVRNVAKKPSEDFVKAFMHNGFFKSLETVVHFYNTRDTKNGGVKCEAVVPLGTEITEAVALANNCWPESEVVANRTPGILAGNLGMNAAQEAALVAYLKTLTDVYTAEPPALLEPVQTDPVINAFQSMRLYERICELADGGAAPGCLPMEDVAEILGEDNWALE